MMGFSLGLIAKEKGIRFWGDRYHVLLPIRHQLGAENLELMDRQFKDPERGLPARQALRLLDAHIRRVKREFSGEDRRTDDRRYAISWITELKNFIERYPKDTFFVISESDDRYSEIIKEYPAEDDV